MPSSSWSRYARSLLTIPMPRPSWCAHVHHDAAPLLADHLERLASSCSPQSQRCEPKTSPVRHSECIRTSGGGSPRQVALHHRQMVLLRHHRLEGDAREVAELGRARSPRRPAGRDSRCAGDTRPAAPRVKILMPCSSANADQIRQPRHRAVVVHDLADDGRRVQPGELGQIHRRLGVARPAAARRLRRSAAGTGGPAAAMSSASWLGSISAWTVR